MKQKDCTGRYFLVTIVTYTSLAKWPRNYFLPPPPTPLSTSRRLLVLRFSSSLDHRLIRRYRPAKCCVFKKELTKIPLTFCFAAGSFFLKEIGGVFEDYSTV